MEPSQDNLTPIWNAITSAIKENEGMPSTAFDLWFSDLHFDSLTEDTAVFSTSNSVKQAIIAKRYTEMLKQYLTEYIGFTPEVQIEARDTPPPENVNHVRSPLDRLKELKREREEGRQAPPPEVSSLHNPDYTFENFIVGESNKFAQAAALAVAKNPGSAYNPLFIYGPSGLGKTHLMSAIANRILERKPDTRVIYEKGENFTNQLVEAIQNHSTAAFREKYRKTDILMIDDIQFIAGKTATQEEFFHTFNCLYDLHKQIIVTSDRPPKEMATLEDRIRSRFEAGLLADIGLPDYELRLAILRHKAESVELRLPDEAAIFLADNLHSNIRQIEGVIKKLGAMQFLKEEPITIDYIRQAVPEFLKDSMQASDMVNRIISVTAQHFMVSEENILGKSRQKEIKTARNVAMYVIREATDLSLSEIGMMMGRDHSTVHSNIQAVEQALRSDSFLNVDVDEILKEIRV